MWRLFLIFIGLCRDVLGFFFFFFELTVHEAEMHLDQWQAITYMEKAGSHGITPVFISEF